MEQHIVIGIEGLVGSGKTTMARELLKYIPNSILLHGGNIYRAVVFALLNSGVHLEDLASKTKNLDSFEILKKFHLSIAKRLSIGMGKKLQKRICNRKLLLWEYPK